MSCIAAVPALNFIQSLLGRLVLHRSKRLSCTVGICVKCAHVSQESRLCLRILVPNNLSLVDVVGQHFFNNIFESLFISELFGCSSSNLIDEKIELMAKRCSHSLAGKLKKKGENRHFKQYQQKIFSSTAEMHFEIKIFRTLK